MSASTLTKEATDMGSAANAAVQLPTPDFEEATAEACGRIAPTWPLDRFIAVNPFWGMTNEPIADVDATLRAFSGARLLMPRDWYRDAYRDGRLRDAHLEAAIERTGSSATLNSLVSQLEQDETTAPTRSLLVDIADAEHDLAHEMSWKDFVTFNLSQFCASYFDEGQATLKPNKHGGLYASWRRQALGDKGPALLMGMTSYSDLASTLPESAYEMIRTTLSDTGVPEDEAVSYLHAVLLDINGWASWCRYRGWVAELEGREDDTIADLLAIRLAWEWMLYQGGGNRVALQWRRAIETWPAVDSNARDSLSDGWVLQKAMEIAWQENVIRDLPAGLTTPAPSDVAVQAAFCIDVRSEVFRRALEAQSASVQTLGFAGFFGVPIDYQPLGSQEARPQLPGLLAPRLRATDTGLDAEALGHRADHLDVTGAWKSLKTGAVSTFVFVEAIGLSYIAKLLKDSFGKSPATKIDQAGLSTDAAARRKPRLTQAVDGSDIDIDAQCDLAAGILRAMSLTHDFARLVLLAGHGSETRNNPHAAGLDCGACCGQTGEVNARAAAALLNDPAVRQGLSERGISIPETTRFVAGLHNTTTDEVSLFDLDELPSSHTADLTELQRWLAGAGTRAREERAPTLGLAGKTGDGLFDAIRERTRDWAQVRPEWGLANNASFIIAPREHTRHLNLAGRSFLHDYRHQEDDGYGVLELLMTAPMVVTHWINMQYYASTVDNLHYGSGNKVLHNVVGGHLGVFEGNGGDLRIGLSMQSLHDGKNWVNQPLRLSVFIEAPREAIDGVLEKHAHVNNLVTNGWIDLFQIDAEEGAVNARRDGKWIREEAKGPDSASA